MKLTACVISILGSELPHESRQDLLELLLRTYPLYVDRSSRYAVQECLRSLIKAPAPSDDVKYLIQRLKTETSKPGLAATSAFVLVEWCSELLQHVTEDSNTPLETVLDLITVDAKALEDCLAASPKSTVKQSALRVTRRALRAVFSSKAWGEDAVRQSVGRLTSDSTSGQKNAPFLGVICGVCARLPTKKPVLNEQKKAIIAFYAKELIGSRSAVPPHIANGLSDFFISFATYEDVEAELIPPFEKAILRAPEVVLGGLIPSLCSSLPEDIDLSDLLLSRLLKHLVSSMKSSNPTIRQGAISSFQSLLVRSKAEGSLLKIANEIVSPLKTQKITNPEQRAVFAQSLTAILPSVALSTQVVQGLVPAFAKESNEPALEQEIKAFCKHLAFLVQSAVKIGDDVVNTIVKGASDKKIPFRKLWQLNVGEVLWKTDLATHSSPEVEPLITKFINKMKEMFNEVASNPLPSAQNGGLSTAYIYLALLGRAPTDSGAWESTVAQSMVLTPKPSFLLNPRAYVKLTSQAEVQWVVRALGAIASGSKFEAAEHEAKVAWAQAFIYSITAPGLHTDFREQSACALSDVYLKNQGSIARIVIDGLWAWILAFRTGEKESAPVSAGPGSEHLLHLVARAICPPASSLQQTGNTSDLKNELVELLVLSRTELIPKAEWIALCLRTGTDPGNLVREFPGECLKQLTRIHEVSHYSFYICHKGPVANYSQEPVQSKIPQVDTAIWSAAGDLAFVAPDTMMPQLVGQIKDDLNAVRLSRFTPTDAAIARTPEGTMFIDVLSNKSKQPAFDKNTKDYDTLKWEEDLRAQLAEKKGQKEKKLNPEEQGKVKAQLAKESQIRGEVLHEIKRVERGAGIIQGLATGPPNDVDSWINPAVNSLISLMEAGAGLFVGDVVSKTFVLCADKLSPRLGTLRPFVGVATLRAIGRTYLSPEMEIEPLGGRFRQLSTPVINSLLILFSQNLWQESSTVCDLHRNSVLLRRLLWPIFFLWLLIFSARME